ncbi:helix-turn-helix domain-containing protein [Herbaspirillum rhizosphaerae]|uniref:helix-turn-helix domain-containing protein n=1 Tax=Herbaspirillum rhizosphaerae TaxID=346179 RepID=UPI00067DB9CF|nr:AraC family transcriptional regulator [Herbaspirillum rhizosphaerae]
MRAIFEAITPEPGSSWAFLDRRLSEGIPFEWHHHPEYELTLTLNSRGYRYIGDDVEPYDDGDLVLIGPGIPHSWLSREVIDPQLPHTALVIWFTQEWVAGLAASLPEFSQVQGILARASQGLRFGADARQAVTASIVAMREAPVTARLLLLLNVLHELSLDHDAAPLSNVPRLDNPRLSAEPRIARVLNHLHTHFATPLAAAEMATIACVSVSGFHRMFRRHTRMTMVDYLSRLRIGRACSLLIASSQAISSIASEVGYTNLSLFNRQFARIKGEAPSAFRKRHRTVLGAAAH